MIDQASYWNGPAGQRWVHEQAALDAMLRPFGGAAVEAARVTTGQSVLDVGCGCGETSLDLAELVGPGGRVVGADLSEAMLARARERGAGRAGLTWLAGDVSRAPLQGAAFDLVFSRFGVMFFTEPRTAFAHLRQALRPTGRLAFVCWRALADNPWAGVPFDAAARVLGAPEDPSPPEAPGPFAFADAARVRGILEGAGFRDVSLRPFDDAMSFGGSGSLADAALETVRVGPVARLLVDRDASDVQRALAAIEATLPRYAVGGGRVSFPAAAWVVTASHH
jgi:SAM-dependent methyltransferase